MIRRTIFFTITVFLISLSALNAQRHKIEGQFGIHVFHPQIQNAQGTSSRFSHNFWLGLAYQKSVNSSTEFHTGLFTNGANYRFTGKDSPTTTFITMNYLSIPFLFEWKLKNPAWGIMAGAEVKRYITGHLYTAQPSQSTRINLSDPNSTFNPNSLAIKCGIAHHRGPLNYFLMASADLVPFRSYLGKDIYDFRITFGFTMFTTRW